MLAHGLTPCICDGYRYSLNLDTIDADGLHSLGWGRQLRRVQSYHPACRSNFCQSPFFFSSRGCLFGNSRGRSCDAGTRRGCSRGRGDRVLKQNWRPLTQSRFEEKLMKENIFFNTTSVLFIFSQGCLTSLIPASVTALMWWPADLKEPTVSAGQVAAWRKRPAPPWALVVGSEPPGSPVWVASTGPVAPRLADQDFVRSGGCCQPGEKRKKKISVSRYHRTSLFNFFCVGSGGQTNLYDVVSRVYQVGFHLFWRRRSGLCGRRELRQCTQNDFLLPSAFTFPRVGGCGGSRLCDDLSPAHFSSRYIQRECEAATGQLHNVCGGIVWFARLGGGLDGHSLGGSDGSCGSSRNRNGHWRGDDGLVGARYELDLTALWHYLDCLSTLDLRHHLVLDVCRSCGVGASRAGLDGEDNGVAVGRRAQDDIALWWQKPQVFWRSWGNGSWLYGKESARLGWHRGTNRCLSSRGADFTTGGSQESQRGGLRVLQGGT